MINAIPKRLMVVAGVVVLLVGALYLADKNGYSRAVADYSVEAAELAEEARKKQATEQIAVNDLADQYYQAQEREREKSIEVDALKRALRERDSRASGDNAPYELFNKAADSANLPDNQRTRLPDAEKDGFDAIQIGVREYNAVAAQVNSLISIIEASECFKPP